MSERIIKFTPAFNKTDPDPSKNYGIGAIWPQMEQELKSIELRIREAQEDQRRFS